MHTRFGSTSFPSGYLGEVPRRLLLAVHAAILAGAFTLFTMAETAAAPLPGDKKPAQKPVKKKPTKSRRSKNAVVWHSLPAGLEKVRKESRPVVVLFEPDSTPTPEGAATRKKKKGGRPKTLAGLLSEVSVKKAARPFIHVRLHPSDLDTAYPGMESPRGDGDGKAKKGAADSKKDARRPLVPGLKPKKPAGRDPAKKLDPTKKKDAKAPPGAVEARVGARFALRGDESALLVLDFRERVVLRYDGEIPKASRLNSRLRRIAKVNALYVREARRVEKILDKALYAFGAGDTRVAILRVRDLEHKKAKAKMDPVLTEQVNAVIERFRKKARAETSAANQLDRRKDYQAALLAFEKIMRDFPFVDVQKYAAKRKGEIWRKLTFGG